MQLLVVGGLIILGSALLVLSLGLWLVEFVSWEVAEYLMWRGGATLFLGLLLIGVPNSFWDFLDEAAEEWKRRNFYRRCRNRHRLATPHLKQVFLVAGRCLETSMLLLLSPFARWSLRGENIIALLFTSVGLYVVLMILKREVED